MHFRSFTDLNNAILRNLHRVPHHFDAVVGVPRSGILPATLFGLAFNLPVADAGGFLAGRVFASGRTRRHQGLDRPVDEMKRILVVDDSIATGATLERARAALTERFPDKQFSFCAVYGLNKTQSPADIILERVPAPRIFQWNIMHSWVLAESCVDIDGVLCADPTRDENDDGPKYLNFLSAAAPLHIPTKKIGTLVTSRLEKYRPQTELWLRRHRIEYEKLVMLDLPDMATRQRLRAHGEFKAGVYRSSAARLFIESEPEQARQIASLSGRPVLCIKGPELLAPGILSPRAAKWWMRQATIKAMRFGGRYVNEDTRQRIKNLIHWAPSYTFVLVGI